VTTHRDVATREVRLLAELEGWTRLAAGFVLFVAACSLTVSIAAGLLDRRRPFALLRASGLRVGELRRVVLLETAVPMTVTVLFGVGIGLAGSYALSISGSQPWSPPGAGFALALAVGLAAALAVTCVALPLINAVTRHHTVRYE
jgi:ABC-type antimicrobial peptide transport system permease subunit